MTESASYIRRALQISSCQEAVALEDQYDMQEQTLGSRLTNLWSREKTDENTPVVPTLIRGGSDGNSARDHRRALLISSCLRAFGWDDPYEVREGIRLANQWN
jgi:hypothetical protein